MLNRETPDGEIYMHTHASQVRIVYRGRVQGVGFRATVQDIARGYDVVGTVCNASDGSVILEAASTKAELTAFLDAIADRLSRNIDQRDIQWNDSGGVTEMDRFEIGPDRWVS